MYIYVGIFIFNVLMLLIVNSLCQEEKQNILLMLLIEFYFFLRRKSIYTKCMHSIGSLRAHYDGLP